MAPGGAEGAAQPDLGAAFEDGDDHDVGHPDRADEQRDRTQAQEQDAERAFGLCLGDQGGGRLGDFGAAGVSGVGLGGEQGVDALDGCSC